MREGKGGGRGGFYHGYLFIDDKSGKLITRVVC